MDGLRYEGKKAERQAKRDRASEASLCLASVSQDISTLEDFGIFSIVTSVWLGSRDRG
jgi:hypothetical protein